MAKTSSPKTTEKTANATDTPVEKDSNLPLFFNAPAPLSIERHAGAGLNVSHDVSYARHTNSILINAAEFYEASKYYPIVFTQSDTPLPAIVVGLEKTNYFIDEDGYWLKGAYIPAYVRKYPFIFMDIPENGEFLLCVDEGAPQFKEKAEKDSMPFYKGEEPSELTQKALDFCTLYQEHHKLTQAFCKEMQEADMLVPTRSDAKLFNEREIHMAGFLAVNDKKMDELPDEQIIDYYKKGYLPLLYAALMSSSNWDKLVQLAGTLESEKNDQDRLVK